jgi:type IV secretory pathway protease TraF
VGFRISNPLKCIVEDLHESFLIVLAGLRLDFAHDDRSEHRNHPPILLADGQYFVLGDSHDDSKDSREFGPVSEDLLLGKVIATFASGERTR